MLSSRGDAVLQLALPANLSTVILTNMSYSPAEPVLSEIRRSGVFES